MLRNLSLIIRRDITATLRRPFFLFFTLGAPLVTALVAFVFYQINAQPGGQGIAGGETPEENETPALVGIVDRAELLSGLPSEMLAGLVLYPEEAAAQAALRAETIEGYYLVPPDYLTRGELDYFALELNPITANVNAYGLQTLLTAGMLADDPRLLDRVLSPMQLQVTTLAEEQAAVDLEGNWFTGNIALFMVILLYMVILIPASTLVTSLIDEKKNMVMEVLLCSVSPMQLFVGKLLATGAVGLLQILLWVGVLWGVGTLGGRPLNLPEGYTIPPDLLVWGVIFALLGYLMYGAQLAGVGAIAPDLNESRSVTLLVMSPLIVGYVFSTVIAQDPHSLLAYVLSYFPLTAPVAMIGRLGAAQVPLWEPLLSVLLQVAAIIFLVRTFGRLFHARLMLSGQPLTIKRLFEALRG